MEKPYSTLLAVSFTENDVTKHQHKGCVLRKLVVKSNKT